MSARTRLGSHILGLRVPGEFEGFWLRFESPKRVLGDFGNWLESELAVADGGADDGEAARERRLLAARMLEVCVVTEADTVRERLRLALAEVGIDDAESARLASSDPAGAEGAGRARRDRPGGSRELGSHIFGLPVPQRFRSSGLRFKSAPKVLGDFGRWIESNVVVVEEGAGGGGQASDDRRVLVKRAIEVRDIAKSDDVRERLRLALAEVGVVEIDAAHEPFDPRRHQAVDRVPPASADQDGMVAEVERAGYNDHGQVVRKPEVVVYHRDATA